MKDCGGNIAPSQLSSMSYRLVRPCAATLPAVCLRTAMAPWHARWAATRLPDASSPSSSLIAIHIRICERTQVTANSIPRIALAMSSWPLRNASRFRRRGRSGTCWLIPQPRVAVRAHEGGMPSSGASLRHSGSGQILQVHSSATRLRIGGSCFKPSTGPLYVSRRVSLAPMRSTAKLRFTVLPLKGLPNRSDTRFAIISTASCTPTGFADHMPALTNTIGAPILLTF